MAYIRKRFKANGDFVWSLQIRRKGHPPLSMSFETEKEAKKWAFVHEKRFLEDPNPYLKMKSEK